LWEREIQREKQREKKRRRRRRERMGRDSKGVWEISSGWREGEVTLGRRRIDSQPPSVETICSSQPSKPASKPSMWRRAGRTDGRKETRRRKTQTRGKK
jgi:hypothetical protein